MTSTTTTPNSDDILQKEEEYDQNTELFGIDEFEYQLLQEDIKERRRKATENMAAGIL